ncbi:MAG: hypothetical protein Q7U20_06580 [Caulobacter sp.]|nr:hypothetical protein [Caulobacter sp.]
MAFSAQLSRLIGRLGKPLMVVCALMLAFAPIADGLICGLEPATAEAGVLDAGHDGDNRDSSDPDHAVCAHGHCHHGSALTGGADIQVATALYAETVSDRMAAPQPPSANQPTLKRPPRV